MRSTKETDELLAAGKIKTNCVETAPGTSQKYEIKY